MSEAEAEAIPAESEPEREPKVFATKSSLPEKPYAEVFLPVLDQWVYVRYMGGTEAASLAFLPEMTTFGEIMAERMKDLNKADGEVPPMDVFKQLELEKTRYSTLVAHAFVLEDPNKLEPAECPECSLKHPPALWTRVQCDLLEPPDLEAVTQMAEHHKPMESFGPFSEAPTPSDTPTSADTGESTPPKT